MNSKMLVQLEGVSSINLLNQLVANNIAVSNYTKIGAKSVKFEINASIYPQLLVLAKEKCYNVNILRDKPFVRLLNCARARLGIVIGIVIVVVCNVLFSRFTFSYHIMGLDTLAEQTVVDKLQSFGIRKGKINHFDNAQLEVYLRKEIPQISLVSVATKGNVLIVNIKEKLPEIDTSHVAITAPQNMLITDLQVIAGTPMVKVGDVAVKGTELVAPYYYDAEGKQISCQPIAKVTGDVWYVGSVQFQEDRVEYKRTGKKIRNATYYMGSKQIFATTKPVTFATYEVVERKVSAFKNLFFPFNIAYKYYFETKPIQVHTNYEDVKDKLASDSSKLARQSVPQGCNINDEKLVVSQVGDIYTITTYLRSSIEVN